MKKAVVAVLLLSLCACAWTFPGCIRQQPQLLGTPTPSASPTPLPEPYFAEVTGAPLNTDMLGAEIESPGHYEQYLAFGDWYVYEYDNGTFLDAICVNGYPKALDGELEIRYYTADGQVCGEGRLHNASGGTELAPGSNRIYAEINTDIDVRTMDFKLETVTPFAPVKDAETP